MHILSNCLQLPMEDSYPLVIISNWILYHLNDIQLKMKTCPLEYFVVLLFYVHGKHLRSCRDGQ